MGTTNSYLYATLFLSMLETNVQNCLDIYSKLDLGIEDKLIFLTGTASSIIADGMMTKEISDKVHILYNKLLTEYPSQKFSIVEHYNKIKGLLNICTLDTSNRLIYEDICQREFSIYDARLYSLYADNAKNFYTLHYHELMDDIAFDYNVINYLTHTFVDLDNEICKDKKFIKSLKYIVNLASDNLDYESYIKIKMTLEYRETLLNSGFIDNIKTKNEHKKIMKKMRGKYDE